MILKINKIFKVIIINFYEPILLFKKSKEMSKNLKKTETFYNIPKGYEIFEILKNTSDNENLVYIVKDDKKLKETLNFFDFFYPQIEYLKFPAWDTLPYDRLSPNKNILAERMKTLNELVHSNGEKRKILITTLNAVIQKTLPFKMIKENFYFFKSGQTFSQKELIKIFEKFGYKKQPYVATVGEYSLRGGIVDFFSPYLNKPIRLDFFGDCLEEIKIFHVENQISFKKIEEFFLYPIT